MTMHALKRIWVVMVVAIGIGVAGCSKENRDWRSAQAADSLESYDQFLAAHPESERAAQARARLLQLTEDRDWQRASTADTADAYHQFLNQHPSGKWSAEARIRAENFALERQPLNAPIQSAVVPVGGARVSPSAVSPVAARPGVVQGSAVSVPTSAAGFGIQLGAFGTEEKAQTEWLRLQSAFADELGALHSHVAAVTTAAGNLFRLQASVENEARARAICASLAEKSQACVVVLPH